jgi:hypothetical protein
MIKRISDFLKIDNNALENKGVLDGFVGIDTLLFLDPFLIKGTNIPEFLGTRKKIIDYFEKVTVLLSASNSRGDKAWREALKRLIFKETPGVYIGYGSKSIYGKAIGKQLAIKLVDSAQEILSMGIKDPEIFELLGLFEDGFGADRLSDMTIRIIRDDLFEFTQRICKELKITTILYKSKYAGKQWNLPESPNQKHSPLILLPKEFLRDLPVAYSPEQIDYVVRANQELRDRFNKLIGRHLNLKKARKQDIKNVFFSNPDNLKYLLESYKSSERKLYNYEIDPADQIIWSKHANDFSNKYPLKLVSPKKVNLEELKNIVIEIIKQFQLLIEDNGLNQFLYIKKNRFTYEPRHERYSQLLFYAIADSYCRANNIDISREPNAGRGAVDFKFSNGYFIKIVVEIKLTTNKNLYKGFSKQLPTYQKGEKTQYGFLITIKNNNSNSQLKMIEKDVEESIKHKILCPQLFVIDGRIRPSASNIK